MLFAFCKVEVDPLDKVGCFIEMGPSLCLVLLRASS